MRRALLSIAFALAATSARAAPIFVDRTADLGSPQPCFDPKNPDAEGCYTHYVLLADLDGDADLDLVFAAGGGYYAPAGTAPLLVFANDGSGAFSDARATVTSGFVGRTRQVAIGDVDGDGDLDLFAPQGYGARQDGITDALFLNDGGLRFHRGAFAGTSRAGATRLADLDGDGDLDLVVTDWGPAPPTSPGTARLLDNDGSGHFSERSGAIPDDTASVGTGPIDVDASDVDGDFDLDLVIASREGDSLLFLNDGHGTFARAPLPPQPGPYVYGPDECDVDGDGDLDLILDNGAAGHTEQLLINDGTGHFTDDTSRRITGNPHDVDDNRVTCADVDGDGDFDVIVASLTDHERVLENDGTGHFSLIADAFPPIVDSTLGLDAGDVDGDHVLDVVTAQGESGPFLNRLYVGVAPAPADGRAPVIRAVEPLADGQPAGPRTLRFAVSDAATTDLGPRVSRTYLEVGDETIPAAFVGGDLFRATFAATTDPTSYRACAVDVAGNVGCGEPRAIRVSGLAGGSGGSGGSGGGSTVAGSSSIAGAPAAAGSSGAPPIPTAPIGAHGGCAIGGHDDDALAIAIALAALSRAARSKSRSRSR